MKKLMVSISLLFSTACHAQCHSVYTIGAYDQGFRHHALITKLGPMSAVNVLAGIPRSFLENDGSYAGGEAFCTIAEACHALKKQLASGVLPATEKWHIYLLDATWQTDTYHLRANDYRIKHDVKVIKEVRKRC